MDTFEWEDLVKHYEIISSTGANIQKVCQWTTQCVSWQLSTCRSQSLDSPGICSHWNVLRGGLLQTSCIGMIANHVEPFPSFGMSSMCNQPNMPCTLDWMHIEQISLSLDLTICLTHQPRFLPVQKKTDDMMKVLSLYGGGFGGWAFAVTHLNAYHGIPTQHIAVESNMEACISFAVQHDVPVLNGYYDIPFKRFQGNFKGCVIHGNAVSTQWMTPVAQWGPNVVTISAPCPPWSQASKGKGLCHS